MSRVGTRPTRSNSLRAMIENSASPLPEAMAPTAAVEAEISPATGACTATVPPSGSVSRASVWPGGDGIAGIGQHFGDLQPHAARAAPASPRARMMVPDTSTMLPKQDFAAFSTVTAAPLGWAAASSAANAAVLRGTARFPRGGRQAWSRANRLIGVPFPVFGGHGYQMADRRAKRQGRSAPRQADHLAPSAGRPPAARPASSSARAICADDLGVDRGGMRQRQHMPGIRQMADLARRR